MFYLPIYLVGRGGRLRCILDTKTHQGSRDAPFENTLIGIVQFAINTNPPAPRARLYPGFQAIVAFNEWWDLCHSMAVQGAIPLPKGSSAHVRH